MARSKTTNAPGMIDAFSYSPGDGYQYRWMGGADSMIAVYRITVDRSGRLTFDDTGDRIDATGVARTASGLAACVDTWRAL